MWVYKKGGIMGLLLIGFIVLSAVMTFTTILYVYKYKQNQIVLDDICKYNKIGFIQRRVSFTDFTVEFEELERFKNGYSRVRIIKTNIQTTESEKISDVKKHIKDNWTAELIKTESINWLERDENLMEVRKKKLERVTIKNI